MTDRIINHIGKYKIIDTLSGGNMGSVYAVLDTVTKREYVMKLVKKCESKINKESLYNEWTRLKDIKDRSFPYVVDYVENDDYIAIVMEKINGVTLEEYIRNNAPLTIKESLTLITNISKAIGTLHSMSPKIVYRDLKPSNIMLENNSEIRIIDFGAVVSGYDVIKSPFSVGTYGYASIEQLEGKELTTSSDVYSIGAILYYMLTGIDPAKPPYELEDIRKAAVTIPEQVCKIIDKCLACNPKDRYIDANEVVLAINKIKNYRERVRFNIIYFIYYIAFIILTISTCRLFASIYKTDIVNVKELYIHIVLCICMVIISKTLNSIYKSKYFFRKREINIICTEKKYIGLL